MTTMKISGIIQSRTEHAAEIAESLSPDNGEYMTCEGDESILKAGFSGTSLRTVLATVDDYLMNLSVAWQIHASAGDESNKTR